ncbi:MAG: ECF transporter S component [Peptoniphilus sp.]|nr:ECF transporter S component [Peptoniphilus sp.]MDY3118374.1 ECF transporter S component [Peptoniphilus sp.]
MKTVSTKKLTMIAMFMALTTVATMVIQIPIPATKGYLNVGDTLVIASALLMGKTAGGLIGGIGSALADLLSGYGYYAPITLVVKGLEGYVAGLLHEKTKMPFVLSGLAGGAVMAVGYLLAEGFILYNFPTALASFVPNFIQGIAGALLADILYPLLRRALKEEGVA